MATIISSALSGVAPLFFFLPLPPLSPLPAVSPNFMSPLFFLFFPLPPPPLFPPPLPPSLLFLQMQKRELDGFEFEPERSDVFGNLHDFYVGCSIYGAMLDNIAAEQVDCMGEGGGDRRGKRRRGGDFLLASFEFAYPPILTKRRSGGSTRRSVGGGVSTGTTTGRAEGTITTASSTAALMTK